MTFGQYIKSLRVDKGLSLREVARRSDISHPYLSQLENGKNKNPTPDILSKLSKGLNVDYIGLLYKLGDMEEAEREVGESILKEDNRIKVDAPLSYSLDLISEQIRLGTVFAFNEKKLSPGESNIISRIDNRIGYFFTKECTSIPESELAGLSRQLFDSIDKELLYFLDFYNKRQGKDES